MAAASGEWKYILCMRNNECVLVSCDVSLVLYRTRSCLFTRPGVHCAARAQPTPFLVFTFAVRAEYMAAMAARRRQIRNGAPRTCVCVHRIWYGAGKNFHSLLSLPLDTMGRYEMEWMGKC